MRGTIFPGLSLALAGCAAVGPDYRGAPVRTPPAAFVRAPADAATAMPRADWWQALGDPQLNRLVEAALATSGEVKAALARLGAERALLRGREADRLPSVGSIASYARTRPFIAQFGVNPDDNSSIDLYRAQIDASWELDLFGRQRRGVEAARASAGAADAELADVRVAIVADVAESYVALRGLQARIDRVHAVAALDAHLIALTEQRVREGTADQLDLGRIRYQRLKTLADEPALRGAITIQIDRLARLTGRDAGALDAELAPPRAIPTPPAQLAIGDPAGLIRRRPDVRAAERRIAAATARIGVATADLFPRVSLLGSFGKAALEPGDLTQSDATIFSIGPSISWAFLDLGRVRARIAEAGARRDESVALYESTVQAALIDAEAGLTRYARQRETIAARVHEVAAAKGAAALIEQRRVQGTFSLMETLEAARQVAMAEDRLQIAQTDLVRDYVALGKSLGLGWAER